MDSPRPSRSPSRRSSRASQSADNDSDEHPDTPLRKKARTDQGQHSPTRSAPSSFPRPPPRSPDSHQTSPDPGGEEAAHAHPPPTPSRVTLNLRRSTTASETTRQSLDLAGDAATDDPVTDTGTTSRLQLHAMPRHLSPSSDTIEIADRSPTRSPEAVDISLDDDATDGTADARRQLLTPEEELYSRFPIAQGYFGYREGLEYICQGLARGSVTVQHDFLVQLDEWLQRWLALTQDTPHLPKVAFIERNGDFWQTLSLFFVRVLTKKFSISSGSRPRARNLKVLEDLFLAWLEVCGQMFNADSLIIKQTQEVDTSSAPALISHRASLFIRHLVHSDASLWNTLHEQRVNVDHAWASIMTRIAGQPNLHMVPLLELVANCAGALHTWQDAMSKHLIGTLQSLTSIGQYYSLVDWNAIPNDQETSPALARDYIGLIETLENALVRDASKSSLSPANYHNLLSSIYELRRHALSIDSSVTEEIFGVRFPDEFDDENPWSDNEMLLATHHISMHAILWHFIQKGRMELRVWATKQLSDDLAHLYEVRGKGRRNVKKDHFLSLVAKHLEQTKFLEYIVGVDSHPQLVSRSSNIVAFLAACGHWHEYMDELICNAITSSQDGRMKTAIIDMISSLLAHCMTVKEKLRFCQYLTDLPYPTIDNETIACISSLVRSVLDTYMGSGDVLPAALFDICRHLLRRAFSEEADAHPDPICVLNETIAITQAFTSMYKNHEDRLRLYEQCVNDMRNSSERSSAGSIQLFLLLVLAHLTNDADFIFKEYPLSRLVAENICAYVAGSLPSEALHFAALDVRMKLLSLCMEYDDIFDIAEDLEQNLWYSLVGRGALSEPSRNVAWNYLGVIASKTRSEHLVLDRLLDQHLTRLDPDLLTDPALQFVEHGIAYKVRMTTPQPNEQGIVHAPLRDFLWHAIRTTDSTVAHVAMHILIVNYLDTDFIVNADPAEIAATHSNFIETCFEHLQDAAALVRQSQSSPPEAMTLLLPEQQPAACFIHFHRSLELLSRFLTAVRSRPVFKKQPSESPSPVTGLQTDSDQETLNVKYQAYGTDGRDRGMKELHLNADATFATLRDELCKKTGFTNVSTIYQGKRLDLSASPAENVKIFTDGGLLIVKQAGADQESMNRHVSPSANSVAEDSILRRLDALYTFLELPNSLGREVRQLLLQFPPHQVVSELVSMRDTDRASLLFPAAHPEKTLYNLHVLRVQLAQATRVNALDDRRIFQAVEVLCDAVLHLPTVQELQLLCSDGSADQLTTFDVAWWTTNTLIIFLKERPEESFDPILRDRPALVERLVSFLKPEFTSPLQHLCIKAYCALVEASLHSRTFWARFNGQQGLIEVHEAILLECAGTSGPTQEVVTLISDVCAGTVKSTTSVTSTGFTAFYWPIIQSILPKALHYPAHCGHLFALAVKVFSAFAESAEEADLRQLFTAWAEVLLQYQHEEMPGKTEVNDFVPGMTKLLLLCLQYLRAFKKPIGQAEVMSKIFAKYLFPPLATRNTSNHSLQTAMPVLKSTARKELYDLTLGLCEDTDCFVTLCTSLNNLANEEQQVDTTLPAGSDHQAMLRAPAGYVGLRNLTNTCYMNSLMTQLFMNADFRDFFISADFIDGSQHQKLLSATKQLLTRMQRSYSKWEDTEAFAAAIQPYDAPEIDVTIQMDVDEFYNLLFDRWESQLPDRETKSRFRSFFGGQLVTQVKSLDCEHVSERLEDYFAIQCEVKGKATLTDSLRAYVQGDVMEGDNKYKCESCGGRFVNAIKRSCLKEIPDSLIFHLKRFDFDLTTMQRSKINDRFEFPRSLDMNEYNVAFMDESGDERNPDMFELTGVLVHNGTAETGHYYSYIRNDTVFTSNGTNPWLEFNDTVVEDYDPNKLATDSFGGESNEGPAQWPWMKPNSAYMLFYRRRTPRRPRSATMTNDNESTASVWQQETEETVLQDNKILMRRACQLNPVHSQFLQALLSKLKNLNHDICSDGHGTEDLAIALVIRYLHFFGSRSRDLDQYELVVRHLLKHALGCARCCMAIMTYMIETENVLLHLLTMNPYSRVRSTTRVFFCDLLSEIRNRHPDVFGINTKPTTSDELSDWEDDGAFPRLGAALSAFMPGIAKWCRTWSEYFELLMAMAAMGLGELAMLLDQNILLDICALLVAQDENSMAIPRTHENNRIILVRAKKVNWSSLVVAIAELYQRINQMEPSVQNTDERHFHFDWETMRFPLSETEAHIIARVRTRNQRHEFAFLAKLLEMFDPELPDITAQLAVIRSIVLLDEEHDQHSLVANTIANSICEWQPWAAGPSVQMAMVYCRHISRARTIRTLVDGICENAKVMTESSSRSNDVDRGGVYYLDFFKALLQPDNFHCSDESPLLQAMVLESLCQWVPSVLFCDAVMVRNAVVAWLEDVLFAYMPIFSKDDESTSADAARTRAVRRLFEGCYMYIEYANHRGKSQLKATFLLTILTRCADWIRSVGDGVERGITAYLELHDEQSDEQVERLMNGLADFKWISNDADDAAVDDAFATETDENFDSDIEDEPTID